MRNFKPEKYIIPVLVVGSIIVLSFWFIHDPVRDLNVSLPGLDNRPKADTSAIEIINIGENFSEYASHNSSLTGKWSRLRGDDFDNINKEKIKLIDKWGPDGPKILWKVDLGEGHAAPAVYNGRVYLLDYDEIRKRDALRCFALETGTELWKRSYNVHVKRNHGMSRTVPAVNDKYVVTIGPRGHVMCSGSVNGEFIWGIDLVKEYKSEIPYWYTGQCPLIENNIAIIAPGGTSLIIALDCATGEVLWETPNENNWKLSHSSIIPMTFEGKKMYVYFAVGGICGISAEGDDVGNILWSTKHFSPTVVAPSPLVLDDGKLFVTAGYGAGSTLFQLVKEGSSIRVNVLQKFKPREGLASEQQTPLFSNGYVYGILPKDAGMLLNQMVCCNTSDFTNFIWTSGKTERFGLGPYIIADNKFFILKDDGTLCIAKADETGFQVLDKVRVIEGHDAWGPIAITDGYLLMRDSKQLVCLNVRADE